MKSYPIYLDYDHTTIPIGRVELVEDTIPDRILPDIAIVPVLIKNNYEENFHILEFGLIQRINVDTRPRTL